MRVTSLFKETDRQHDAEFLCEIGHSGYQRIALRRRGELEVINQLVLTEIRSLEQFLDQDRVRTLRGGGAHKLLRFRDVLRRVPGTGKLGCCKGYFSHAGSCWVMQWMPPPPSTISSASIWRISRSGNS